MSNECKALLSQDAPIAVDKSLIYMAFSNTAATNSDTSGYKFVILTPDDMSQVTGNIAPLSLRTLVFYGIARSPDGKYIALSANSTAGYILNYNDTTGKFDILKTLPASEGVSTDASCVIEFSPDGEYLVMESNTNSSRINFYKNNGGAWDKIASFSNTLAGGDGFFLKTGYGYFYCCAHGAATTIDIYKITGSTVSLYSNSTIIKMVTTSITGGIFKRLSFNNPTEGSDSIEYIAYLHRTSNVYSKNLSIIKAVTTQSGVCTLTDLTDTVMLDSASYHFVSLDTAKINGKDVIFAQRSFTGSTIYPVFSATFDQANESLVLNGVDLPSNIAASAYATRLLSFNAGNQEGLVLSPVSAANNNISYRKINPINGRLDLLSASQPAQPVPALKVPYARQYSFCVYNSNYYD